MKLTAQMIKDKAKELGLDCIAIGSIDRYQDAPVMMSPKTYFPECKTMITVAKRIPRGSYRGIIEGTHWHNYTYYSYNKLNTLFRPRLTYALACFIEDFGFEAIPHYPAGPEVSGRLEPLALGKLPPEVVLNARIMAAGTGMGEIGHSKVFITPEFGPRVRIGMIMTDAELEPDPIIETGTYCNRCGRCARDCPGNAIPPSKDTDKYLHINLGDKDVYWGDVNMGRCTLTHHGMNNIISPFLKKDMPNMEFDVPNSNMTEEEAYMLTHTISGGSWLRKFDAKDEGVIHYYKYIRNHVGYNAFCGARGCICSCMDALEKRKVIKNLFKNPLYKRPLWSLSVKKAKQVGSINFMREQYLDKRFPGIRKNEYQYEDKKV
jgi:epoxyqueuosine reductase QueG